MGHHQEADGLHAELAGQPEVLDGDVGLGAVGRDAGDGRTGLPGAAQVVHGPDPGHEQHRDLGLLRLLDGGGDQVELVDPEKP